MIISLTFVNLSTSENGPACIDAQAVMSFFRSTISDDAPNVPRKLRGKTLVCITLQNGIQHFTEEEFYSVGERILRARGEKDLADTYKKLADSELAANSRLAV